MTGLPHEIGQDYPRPPLLQPVPQTLRLSIGDTVVGQTDQAWRVCETHPAPGDYLPPEAFASDLLHPVSGGSSCESKGRAG